MDKFVHDKVRRTVSILKGFSEKKVGNLEHLKFCECGYRKASDLPMSNENWQDYDDNVRIEGKDKHYWFYQHVKTPVVKTGKRLVLEMFTGREDAEGWDMNPQGLLYLNGQPVYQLSNNTHRQARLEADKDYELMVCFYTGAQNSARYRICFEIKEIDCAIEQLYYDMLLPLEAAECFDETDYNYIRTMRHLERACNILDIRQIYGERFYQSVYEARKYLRDEYYEKECVGNREVVSYVGSTHIDVAWKWSLGQTREKVVRSFISQLNYMKDYPEMTFMSSQPQLYQYFKEEVPQAYEHLKQMVESGRWEIEGAMWLEADCNLTSGESLVRQIIHGKRFIKEEFGVDSHVLWLPDVFGYSAALPQILQKTGIDSFVTSKISWNETNKMPYDAFMWQGIDGTEIFTYFITTRFHVPTGAPDTKTDYNGHIMPIMHLGTWERFQQKEYSDEVLICYGFGDGGGGVTEEMLERFRRIKYGLPGMPAAKMTKLGDFLERFKTKFERNCELTGRTPKWVGELYLELHRGTYTSIAKNKKNNRECEFLCQTTETLCVMEQLLARGNYPTEIFDRNWKILLLNQFHDVLPGSSIREVNEECDRMYDVVRKDMGKLKEQRLTKIASSVSQQGILVYNPNSFVVSDYVNWKDDKIYVESIPALGWRVISEEEMLQAEEQMQNIQISDHQIESDHYRVVFDEYMNIVSLYDKDNDREVVKKGKTLNCLEVFEDYPRCYDNWEITNYYRQKRYLVDEMVSCRQICGKGYGGFKITRKYQKSTIIQKIVLYGNSRRIDFETFIDWHEHHVILKAAFPTNIHTAKASYEIQFGHIERATHENTSWDAAKFEVCAQKWADVSEEGYGISVLNNCKYGHSAEGGELKLTLLKCGTDPDPEADQGEHYFTYSLYPHADDFKHAGTIQQAYMLNRPLEVAYADGKGRLASVYSFVSCDSPNIIIETVKQAENTDDIVIRLYDAWGMKSHPILNLGFSAEKILLCDMLENSLEELGCGSRVKLSVNNFEIVTLRLIVNKNQI